MLEAHEGTIRLSAFLGVFCFMALLEAVMPRRERVQPRTRRWSTNILMVVIDTFALRIFFPFLAVGAAAWVSAKGWGLFALVGLPVWLEITIAIILLDLAIYGQHVASHRIPLLWKVHRVHHVDRDIDVTTALRFHPIEIVFSMVYKLFWILVLGPAAVAVFLFEVILNGSAMFNHANVRLPGWLDRGLRIIMVTPDTHRIHHSINVFETNSNYGFFLSVWDRFFSTYIAQPREGHTNMTIGLAEYQTDEPGQLRWAMTLPFHRDKKQSEEIADA